MTFAESLVGKRVQIRRDNEFLEDSDERWIDFFNGNVTLSAADWIYVQVDDPNGEFKGIWVNTNLQREIAVLS